MKNFSTLIIFIAVLAVLVPFSGRAFFMDDWYYYDAAGKVFNQPLKPYEFFTDSENGRVKGWDTEKSPSSKNPPLMLYVLGALIRVSGGNVRFVRIAMYLFPLLAALLMYAVAKRFTYSPMFATLLVISTPAFLVTANGMSPYMLVLPLILGSVLAFDIGQEKDSLKWFVLSGLLSGLACLADYRALLIFPVMIIGLLIPRNDTSYIKNMFYYFAGGAVLIAWCAVNIMTYGKMHLPEVLMADAPARASLLVRGISQSSFLGGALVFPLPAVLLALRHRRKVFVIFMLMVSVLFFLLFYKGLGGYNIMQSVMIAAFTYSGLLFVYHSVRFGRLDRESVFFSVWLLIVFAAMLKVVPTADARSLLLLLPPAGILYTRMTDYHVKNPKGAAVFKMLTVILVAGLGVSSLYSDYRQANVFREVSYELEDVRCTGKRCFSGDSSVGLHKYMTESGWKPLYKGTVLGYGDMVLLHNYALPVELNLGRKDIEHLKLARKLEYNSRFPVRVMNRAGSAGFYSSVLGSLPFVFSQEPLERFSLFKYE